MPEHVVADSLPALLCCCTAPALPVSAGSQADVGIADTACYPPVIGGSRGSRLWTPLLPTGGESQNATTYVQAPKIVSDAFRRSVDDSHHHARRNRIQGGFRSILSKFRRFWSRRWFPWCVFRFNGTLFTVVLRLKLSFEFVDFCLF